MKGTPGRFLALLLAVGLGACRTAQPYLAPDGPIYTGSFPPGTAPATAGSAESFRLRVVTFNIEYALRVERALAGLRESPSLRDADIVALQEMDEPGTRAIASGLGVSYAYCPASVHPKYRRDAGNAILSPWPVSDPMKVALPHRSRVLGQARVAIRATVSVAGRSLRVYSLHLGSPLGTSPGQRRDQIDVVLRDAEDSPDPVVIAGDFNSKGLGERLVARGYDWPTRNAGSSTRGFSFDHVFTRGLRLTEVRAGVAREVKDARSRTRAIIVPSGSRSSRRSLRHSEASPALLARGSRPAPVPSRRGAPSSPRTSSGRPGSTWEMLLT